MSEALILVERMDQVAVIRLNRPEVLNALNTQLMNQLADVLEEMDRDEAIRCVVLLGNEKAFAAGADIPEMASMTPGEFVLGGFFKDWDRVRKISKPIVAGVSGYALGGGCELAMCCDLIVATETAQFGQPEIRLGVIPGAGGTQRLTRALGKAKAMEMVLTGASIGAQEAYERGLVNRVVPIEQLEAEVVQLAKKIASQSPLAVQLGKQAIHKAMDLTMEHGLAFEQNAFYLLFSSEDQKEGMAAFTEKRKPQFVGR